MNSISARLQAEVNAFAAPAGTAAAAAPGPRVRLTPVGAAGSDFATEVDADGYKAAAMATGRDKLAVLSRGDLLSVAMSARLQGQHLLGDALDEAASLAGRAGVESVTVGPADAPPTPAEMAASAARSALERARAGSLRDTDGRLRDEVSRWYAGSDCE